MYKRSNATIATFESPATRKRQKTSTASASASASAGRNSDHDTVQKQGKELLSAIEKLADGKNRAVSTAFMKLPSKKLYPDYYTIITKPMALDVIRSNLEEGEYVTLDLMRDDLLQMTNNAKRYNQKGSLLYSDASQIARVVKNWSGDPEAYSEDSDPEVYTPEMNNKTVRNILNAKVKEILQKMRVAEDRGRRIGEVFLELPDKKLYPDYYDLIQRPLAINFIAGKMRKNPYAKLSKFEADLAEMYENAFTYNEKNSIVAQDARALRKLSDKLIAEAGPEIERQERELSSKLSSPAVKTPLAKAAKVQTPSTVTTGGFKIKLGIRQPNQTPPMKVKLNLSGQRATSSLSRVASNQAEPVSKASSPSSAQASPAPQVRPQTPIEKPAVTTPTAQKEVPPRATTPKAPTPNITTPAPVVPVPVPTPVPVLPPAPVYINNGSPLITTLSLAAPQTQPAMVLHIPARPGQPSQIYSWTLPISGASLTVSPSLCSSLASRPYAMMVSVNGRKLASTRVAVPSTPAPAPAPTPTNTTTTTTTTITTTTTTPTTKGNQIWDVKLSVGMNCIECIVEAGPTKEEREVQRMQVARERVCVLVFIR